MTPQSHFTVVAPVAAGREASLRALLQSLCLAPGMADPQHPLLPWARFHRLHFARLALLDDATVDDLQRSGLPRPAVPPLCLALVGDCDGPGDAMLAELSAHAGEGLARLFGHCEGFGDDRRGGALLAWLRAHDLPVQTAYVNRIGRTVRQVREEAALQQALSAAAPRGAGHDARTTRAMLLDFVRTELAAGRLALTPEAPTPPGWRVRNLLHLLALPLLALLLLPLIVVAAPCAVLALRWQEQRDVEHCPRPDDESIRAMQQLEDHTLANSFTALGAVKPGRLRALLTPVVLLAIDYACRHVFGRGHLARIQTIHFARWVFMDGKQRVLFCSNYDGSHEAYMDDFVNKAAWGLNLVFSNGFGWPRTHWLVHGGARHEMRFKHYQRRHQLPTQLWYQAYPGLTLSDLERNRRIRQGVEAQDMSDAQVQAWLALL